MYVIFAPLTRDKNHMVSQMAHAKNLGEPFMAHLENFYNIPCNYLNDKERGRHYLCRILAPPNPQTPQYTIKEDATIS